MHIDTEIQENVLTVLKLRKELHRLSFLIHTMKKDSTKYDDVYNRQLEIRLILDKMGFKTGVSDNMSKLAIIVYMYEHPFEKITHKLFTTDEYLYYDINEDCIKDENQNVFETWVKEPCSYNGIMVRTEKHWEYGWKLYNE
jgi:hypothetical protein